MNNPVTRLALVSLLTVPMSSCNWCTDVFDGFQWKFEATEPEVWEAIEGGELLGTPGRVSASCGSKDDDSTCTHLTMRVSTVFGDQPFNWGIQIVAVAEETFSSDTIDPTTSLRFLPDCLLCCTMVANTTFFEPNDRPAVITSGTWSSIASGPTTVRVAFDLTIEVPAPDPADVADFPACPTGAFRFRVAGSVVGRRQSMSHEDCPT